MTLNFSKKMLQLNVTSDMISSEHQQVYIWMKLVCLIHDAALWHDKAFCIPNDNSITLAKIKGKHGEAQKKESEKCVKRWKKIKIKMRLYFMMKVDIHVNWRYHDLKK